MRNEVTGPEPRPSRSPSAPCPAGRSQNHRPGPGGHRTFARAMTLSCGRTLTRLCSGGTTGASVPSRPIWGILGLFLQSTLTESRGAGKPLNSGRGRHGRLGRTVESLAAVPVKATYQRLETLTGETRIQRGAEINSNKFENVQHKKSVTDGHRRHVLESQVWGLGDGPCQRACVQLEAVRWALPTRPQRAVTVGHSKNLRDHNGRYVLFIASQEILL